MGAEYLLALWGAAGLLLAWLILPDLWLFVRGNPVENRVEEEPGAFERYWDDNVAFDGKFRALERLGFQRVGVYHESVGGVCEREFFLAHPAAQCFAGVYRLSLTDKAPQQPRVLMITTFTSGAAIVTRSAAHAPVQVREDDLWDGAAVPASEIEPVEDANPALNRMHGFLMLLHVLGFVLAGGGLVSIIAHYHVLALVLFASGVFAFKQRKRIEDTEPAPVDESWHAPVEVVLAEHRRRVDVFMQSGHVPVGDYSAQGLLEAERTYYRIPYIRRSVYLLHGVFMTGKLLFLGMGGGIAIYLVGQDHPAVPGALIALSLFWLFSRSLIRARNQPAAMAME